jgi:hypothetical protein
MTRLSCILALIFLFASESLAAAPELYWSTIKINASKDACLNRAKAAFGTEKFPVRKSSSFEVAGWTDVTIASIGCLRIDGRTVATIAVSGKNAAYFSRQFTSGIRTGLFE